MVLSKQNFQISIILFPWLVNLLPLSVSPQTTTLVNSKNPNSSIESILYFPEHTTTLVNSKNPNSSDYSREDIDNGRVFYTFLHRRPHSSIFANVLKTQIHQFFPLLVFAKAIGRIYLCDFMRNYLIINY
jgi:hypothetical protein